MKAYKGFDRDMTCRGFRFEEGKTYKEQEAVLCEKGFHACTDPLDVFKYYSPADMSQYHEVELDDVVKTEDENDSKVCGKKITIGAKLGIKGIVEAFVQIVMENTKKKSKNGDGAKIGSSGDWARIEANGKNSVVMCAGCNCIAKAAIGNWIALAEWKELNGVLTPVCVKAVQVDGVTIKEDTWYMLRNKKVVKVKEGER